VKKSCPKLPVSLSLYLPLVNGYSKEDAPFEVLEERNRIKDSVAIQNLSE